MRDETLIHLSGWLLTIVSYVIPVAQILMALWRRI